MRKVLFLCTGNYYRNRFAEELFNHRIAWINASWRTQSRALAIERGQNNVGPLSPWVLRGLKERGVRRTSVAAAPMSGVPCGRTGADRSSTSSSPGFDTN